MVRHAFPFMVPALRQSFNSGWTPARYHNFLQLGAARCGMPVPFRLNETPCFFPRPLLDDLADAGSDLIVQLSTPQYQATSDRSLPPEFTVPNEAPHPMFIQDDTL